MKMHNFRNGWMVSIHASAREATVSFLGLPHQYRFNPRLRTGGDAKGEAGLVTQPVFQSTPPHGRRHLWRLCLSAMNWFQSTPPHGRRHELKDETDWGGMFQSTPPHGRRQYATGLKAKKIEFQSTPPHGRRHKEVIKNGL